MALSKVAGKTEAARAMYDLKVAHIDFTAMCSHSYWPNLVSQSRTNPPKKVQSRAGLTTQK